MYYVNLHTHTFEHPDSVWAVCNQYPHEYQVNKAKYSIGIHPWYIDENRIESDIKTIKQKLSDANCIALGECGLDKKIKTELTTQIRVFEAQLELVKQTTKPIIIHCVSAFDELIASKKKSGITNPFIIHGFSKNIQVANQLLNQGFYLSFGKHLIQNTELASVFTCIPNEKIFLETDNSTYNIEEVYIFAAKCKDISVEQLKKIVWNNFQTVFNIAK